MRVVRSKIHVAVIGIFAILAFVGLETAQVEVVAADDAAATFKSKCAMCHSATASKFFDPAHADEELIQTILKGKKGEKPPFMPAFGEKGITADQAKELIAYMRQLRSGAPK